MTRPGFDTSPLLDTEFNKASIQYIRGVAPERLTEDQGDLSPELLVHSVKRIHKTPTPNMLLVAFQKTQLPQKQILEVWDAMWASA